MARQNRQNQSAREDAVSIRREHVARLSAAGLSSREIEAKLAELKPPIVADHSTICNDLNEIRPQLREAAGADPVEHLARQFAELQEAKRQCWDDNDLRALARFMALEIRLLGTAAPTRFDIGAQIDFSIFSDGQLRRINEGANPFAILAEVVADLADRGQVIKSATEELERRRMLREQGEKQS